MPHLQTGRNIPPPRRHTWLPTRTHVLNPHGDQTIQDPVPLQMTNPAVVLESGSLDGRPPQEILVVEVIHGIVEIRVPIPIQTVDNMGVLGVWVNDVGTGVRIPPLVGMGDGHLMDTILVVANARHSDEKMRSWLKEARFGGFGRGADDELLP